MENYFIITIDEYFNPTFVYIVTKDEKNKSQSTTIILYTTLGFLYTKLILIYVKNMASSRFGFSIIS